MRRNNVLVALVAHRYDELINFLKRASFLTDFYIIFKDLRNVIFICNYIEEKLYLIESNWNYIQPY